MPNEPFATHFCNVLHLLLPAGEEFFVEVFKQALPLIKDDQLHYLAVSPAARATH